MVRTPRTSQESPWQLLPPQKPRAGKHALLSLGFFSHLLCDMGTFMACVKAVFNSLLSSFCSLKLTHPVVATPLPTLPLQTPGLKEHFLLVSRAWGNMSSATLGWTHGPSIPVASPQRGKNGCYTRKALSQIVICLLFSTFPDIQHSRYQAKHLQPFCSIGINRSILRECLQSLIEPGSALCLITACGQDFHKLTVCCLKQDVFLFHKKGL